MNVEIGLVVLEIQKAEFGNFTVPVNNTLGCHTSSSVFLAADTLLCILIPLISVYHGTKASWVECSGIAKGARPLPNAFSTQPL